MAQLRHQSLVAWQRADDLFVELHTWSRKTLPRSEQFELGGQLRRAAFSVAANIVEGFARRQLRDRLRFLNIAESSLAEVWDRLHVSARLDYLSKERFGEFESKLNQVGAPLGGTRAHDQEKAPDSSQSGRRTRSRLVVQSPSRPPALLPVRPIAAAAGGGSACWPSFSR